MMVEDDKPKEGIGWGDIFGLISVVAVICVGLLIVQGLSDSQLSFAIDKAKQIILDRDDVSDDYRRGWNDCLETVDAWYHTGVNTTGLEV